MKIISKFAAIVTALTLMCSSFGAGFAEESAAQPTVYIDGQQLQLADQPFFESDRVLVPMRAIFEALGAVVTWDNPTNTAKGVKDDIILEITVDSKIIYRNGNPIEIDFPARLVNDARTFVPVRAISEGFGAKVKWNEDTQQVLITTATSEASASPSPTSASEPEPGQIVYEYDELSDEDLQKLKDCEYELRYDFEQVVLPNICYDNEEQAEINGLRWQYTKDFTKNAKDYFKKVWYEHVTEKVIEIQKSSDSKYDLRFETSEESETSAITDEVLKRYTVLIDNSKLGFDDICPWFQVIDISGKLTFPSELYAAVFTFNDPHDGLCESVTFVIGNGQRTTIDQADSLHCYCTVETRIENDGLDEYIGAYSDNSRAIYVFDEENKTLIGSLSDFPGTELNDYLVNIVDVNHSGLTTTLQPTFPREGK